VERSGDWGKALAEMKHLFQKGRSLFAIAMVTIQDEPESQVCPPPPNCRIFQLCERQGWWGGVDLSGECCCLQGWLNGIAQSIFLGHRLLFILACALLSPQLVPSPSQREETWLSLFGLAWHSHVSWL